MENNRKFQFAVMEAEIQAIDCQHFPLSHILPPDPSPSYSLILYLAELEA